MSFDDTFAYRKTQTRAGGAFVAGAAVKLGKNFIQLFLGEALSIVTYENLDHVMQVSDSQGDGSSAG
jgi:hypothetical protein